MSCSAYVFCILKECIKMKVKFNIGAVDAEVKGNKLSLNDFIIEVEAEPSEVIESGKQILDLVSMFKDSINREIDAHTEVYKETYMPPDVIVSHPQKTVIPRVAYLSSHLNG